MIYTVICTDTSKAINWQCELLDYSWKRACQPGELVRLVVAPRDEPLPAHENARVIRIAEPSRRAGMYLAFERLFSLQDWLQAERPVGSVLIIDPDCVFRAAIQRDVEPGAPVAQRWIGYSPMAGSQAATWPALIHTHDLEALLPRWISFTRAIYETTSRWESDMAGFVSAAASLKLRFKLDNIGAFVGWADEDVGESPIVHYCQDVLSVDGEKLWSKHNYRPWQRVAASVKPKHSYCADLLAILNEFADLKSS